MTVCIAALCDFGQAIVMVADREFGLGYTSVQSKHGKFDNFGSNWYVGYSASNAAHATDVITLGRARLQHLAEREYSDIIPKVEQCYQEVRNSKTQALFLASWGETHATFHANGSSRIPVSVYGDVYKQLNSFDLGVDLLIAGFGGAARIFSITNPGISTEQTALGFWSIGSGSAAALASLFSREYDWARGIEEALFYVYEAKVSAEYATGVGTDTDIFLVTRDATPVRIEEKDHEVLESVRKQLEPREFKVSHKNKIAGIKEIDVVKRLIATKTGADT